MGTDITHGHGLTQRVSQASGSERAAKQHCELASGFSYSTTAGPNVTHPEQDVPVPNHREVYSQTHPATLLQGMLNANNILSEATTTSKVTFILRQCARSLQRRRSCIIISTICHYDLEGKTLTTTFTYYTKGREERCSLHACYVEKT